MEKLQAELDRAKRLRDQHDDRAAELQEQLLALTRPQEPDTYSDPPPIIRFKMVFRSSWHAYDYAALGHRGQWYLCQDGLRRPAAPSKSWEQLLRFIPKKQWDTIEQVA